MSARGSVTALALCACFAICLQWAHAEGEPSGSPAITRARAHIAAVEYELAQAALEESLRSGGNPPDVTAAIHGLLGVVAASRDRPAEAQASFERQLAIEPAADVDHELGPKIVEPFMAARTVLGDRAIAVKARPVNGGVDLGLTDPLAMIVSIRAVERSHGGAVIATASSTQARDVHLAIGRDAPRDLTVSVLDAYGNRLADVNVELREDDVATGSSVRKARSRRWMLWAGAAVGFGATGSVFALLARSTQADLDKVIANSGEHTLGEAESLDRRGARETLMANLAFGAAGLFAAGAVIDYVWRRETKPARVYSTASTAGLLLGVAGEF